MVTTIKGSLFPPDIIVYIFKFKYNSSINERADLAVRLMYWNHVIIALKISKQMGLNAPQFATMRRFHNLL
jgi:hypothetical protein